ncbi:unnamed protein product [Brachionus calyciflorus]|uniref:Uncharacterized protein n=1 Tax=Brachionus calyciflorus TaxID=104777 RepID=A0A813STH7_9BILA|nr:unnamed protein product [Brachionus calyciflorus]
MSKKYKIPNSLKCNLTGPEHIIENARKLPCGKIACFKCLEQESNEKYEFECQKCKNVHRINNDLPIDCMTELSLEESLDRISHNLIKTLSEKLINIPSRSDRSYSIESLFQFITENIEIRIESIKSDFDNLEIEMHRQITENKIKSLEENQIKKQNLINLKDKKDSIFKIESFFRINSSNEMTKIISKKDNFALDDLNLDKVGILPNPYKINIDKIELNENKPIFFKLKFHPYDICAFGYGQYLAIDKHNNYLYLLDEKFRKLKEFSKIEGLILKDLSCFCFDSKNEILYLCLKEVEMSQVFKINKNLDKILDIVKLNNILGISVFNHILYVLQCNGLTLIDTLSKLIIKDIKIDFDRSTIYSYQIEKDFLALNLDQNRIYIYNLKNETLCNSLLIDDGKIYGFFCQLDPCILIIHLNNGFDNFLNFYEIDKNFQSLNLKFKKELENSKCCVCGSWRLKYENNKLIGCLWSRDLMVL